MKDKSNTFMNKINEKVLPAVNKFAQERHVSSITKGLMFTVPFTMLGAIFNIIANPPVTADLIAEGGIVATLFGGWFHFATEYGEILKIPVNMTMGIISVIAILGISYNLSKSYKMKGVFPASLMALVMFLIVAAPAESAYLATQLSESADLSQLMPTSVLNASNLGAAGLFVAIIIGLSSVEITRFCEVKNLTIKMPDSVPPMVSQSLSMIIPALLNCIVFFGCNLLCMSLLQMDLPLAITTLLTPVIGNVDNVVTITLLIMFGNLLWLFGIHGTAIVSTIYIPITFAVTAENAQLVAAGQSSVYHPVFLTAFSNTFFAIGLVILLFCKSKQLKAVGKVGFIPSFFQITEPYIFGIPVTFNLILAIPCILAPAISMILGHFAYSTGIITPDFNMIFAQLPFGINALLQSMDIKNFLFIVFLLPVQMLIWYPFLKAYDKQLLKSEDFVIENSKSE